MASWLRSEKKGNQEHIPPPQLKSRIPIRVTRLCSDNFRSSSSKDKANKKVRLQRDSESKVQNKRFSRIPIVVYDKKTKVDSKENLTKNFKTTKGEKPLGRDSGIKLRDSQGKQDKKMASAIPLTRAKYGIYRRAKETTPKVRRRVPRQLTPTATESKKVCKDEKESREESSASEESSAAMAKEVTPDFECNATPVHEEELRMGAEENFSGSEFGDGFGRHSQSSDEKAMSNEPLWLREEYKEREEREENINIMKGDATVTRSARNIRMQPEFDAENKVQENVLNEEELDCSSFTESSGYKRKMAELGEKSRRLKAQFAEESREAIESMNKIEVEMKQSQAREYRVANEIEEMRRRQDEVKDDLELLNEMEKGREPEDKKWREKMDKKKIKVAHRLEKIRAEQRKYQEQTADENELTEETDRPDKNSIESPESERYKHVTLENETVRNTDIGNKVLYEPHEIKEYEGVKELEKKRKELRQLKRLEKNAIKREKLEEKERKKIEKQMRKFASKLEKLSRKSSKALEETAEISKCINQPMEATNTAVKDKVDETPKVNEIKPHVDTTSDIAEPKQVQAAHSPGFNTNGTEVEQLGEMLTKVENKKHIALDSDASAKVELEEQSYSDAVKEKQKTYDCSDGQRKRIDDNNEIVMVSIVPLFRLPEVVEANLTLRDTDSILDESVDSEQSNRNYSNEEVPRQDKFDCFLDEVEGGIRTEESRSKSLQRAENEEDEKNFSECCALSRYQRSVAAVVNISEYLIQQELSKALETAIPDSRKDYTSRSEDSSSEEEPNLHKENEEMEFWKLKREKTDLEIQIFVANNELETYRKRIETVQADLDESKVKVKRLQSEGEYKERELENLKRDFQRKEQKWEEGNELLEEVMAERRGLWDDVDYLEESLKNSQESNEVLTFEVDELKIMMQEINREHRMEHSRGGCAHLREEVKLLNGSLELKEQRAVLLENKVNAFEAERKELWDNVDYLEESLKNSQESNEVLTFEVDELTIMMQEMKRKYRMEHSRGGCGHLREEVELLNGSLALKEQRAVLLENQVNAFEAERKELWDNVDYLEESLKNSQESNEVLTFEVDELTIMMQEMKRKYRIEHSRGGCGHLREEVELLNGSLALKAQQVTLLASQVQSMKREMEILMDEKASRTMLLQELKCETLKTISDLKDEIEKLQKEKFALSSEVSKESEKDNQLYELSREKSWMTRKLEDHITRLRKENYTLTERLSKACEKDDKLTELREKVNLLKNQLKNVTEAAEASANSKEKEMEEDYRIIKKQDETIKNLIEEIRREKSDKDHLELQSAERIRELESQLQRMDDMKRNAVHSVDALVLEVRQERSENEHLKRAMEAKECSSYREKVLKLRVEHLENQLSERDDQTNATLTSLKNNESSLQEANAAIDMLTEQLEREKAEKETLRVAVEVSECNSHNEKRLTEKIEKLEMQLQEMNDLRKETLRSLRERECSLEEARHEIKGLIEQIENKNSDKKCFKRKVKARGGTANQPNLVQKGTKRDTQGKDSLIAHVGKRLKNFVQRPREVYASNLVMKKKKAHAERLLDKLRKDLNEREEVMEDLKSNFEDSAKKFSSMQRELENINCQNVYLIQRLRDKENELQKTRWNLKEREANLDDANETLQCKCSLLIAMEAKLRLRSKEIEELTQANKEKSSEITRIETALAELKKELDIATSIIEKQNEQCVNLKTCVTRKTRDEEEMQDELKRLSTQLEFSRNEKANLHRAVLTAISRKQFWEMKMDLREGAAGISLLEDEKAVIEEKVTTFNGKVSREHDLLKETQYVENKKESSLQLTIGSVEREMAKLTGEMDKQFKIDLLQNGLESKSSESSCEESTFSTLKTRRNTDAYKITFLEDESDMKASSQGDTKNKGVNTSRLDKHIETRGDGHFNHASTMAEVDHTMQNFSAYRSPNLVSILLCNG